MPLYMDIHTVDDENFSVEDVVKAHMEDLSVQDRFGVTQIKYWVNQDQKTLFCLMIGPDKKSCNDVHKESHGQTACNIIEVKDDEFNLFLGEGGKDKHDLAQTISGEIDTGYRTLILVNLQGLFDRSNELYAAANKLIEENKGSVITIPDFELMGSFINAGDAIHCANAINNFFSSSAKDLEYSLAIITGRPVDEVGSDMFEDTKRQLKQLCLLGTKDNIYLDHNTESLFIKEGGDPAKELGNFNILNESGLTFLLELFTKIDSDLFNAEFDTNKLFDRLGLSKSHANRKIKSITKLSPNQLLQELRLRHSLKLLRAADLSISEIAYDCGFNSPTYFTRVFHKRFGVPPTSFVK